MIIIIRSIKNNWKIGKNVLANVAVVFQNLQAKLLRFNIVPISKSLNNHRKQTEETPSDQ